MLAGVRAAQLLDRLAERGRVRARELLAQLVERGLARGVGRLVRGGELGRALLVDRCDLGLAPLVGG